MHHHMFYGNPILSILSMLLPMLILILLIVGAVYMVSRWFGGQNKTTINNSEDDQPALQILKKRYAAGEISREEYISMKEELTRENNDL